MQKVRKYIDLIGIMLMVLVLCSAKCMAAEAECRITVRLEDESKNAIDGLTVSVCKVADISGTDYYPAQGFENSGISISGIVNDPSAENAKNILNYVQKYRIGFLSAVSVKGEAVLDSLEPGIWLVYCSEDQDYRFNPYLVFLPYAIDGELYYEISSIPKTEHNVSDNRSVYVVKKWEDKDDAAKKRPEEITVDLMRDGKVVETAILNMQNGWSYTFLELPEKGTYTIAEGAVADYSVQYNGDSENGFIITNVYTGEKLPQTGQLWWPIAILLVAGVAIAVLGIMELRSKKDETKTE